ncbi:uncharacterized protein LOC121135215 [Mesocricetus auratus]|uniref:Uncharacterized protein LOC121135215 n=1 Tax=Mesocricetus auratus TaxID=10036 RepID=A0ABM2WLU3_MESAU|nr:uncharacterized protein LOC121135215 [Mesocricetus auratus]
MSTREKGPHVRDQHFAEGDDFLSLTPSHRQVTKVTNGSSGEKSAEPTTLQSGIPRRPRGRPATKHGAVERGCSGEKTCSAEKKPSTEKHHIAEKRCIARMYYVMRYTPLPKMLLFDNDSCDDEKCPATKKGPCDDEKCPATKKGPCDRRHQFKKQFSGKRRRHFEKSCCFEKHLSAEKDLPTQRGCLNKKRRLTDKYCSTEEGGLGERGPYEERGHTPERDQPAKKGFSTKKSPSPKKGYLDGRGPSVENHHPEEKDRSAKKLSCTQRDRWIDGERSVKRELSTEEDHPVGRGWPDNKSHLAEKGWSANKSGSPGRGHQIKSHPAQERCSIEWVYLARSRLFAGEDTPTGRGHCMQSCPAMEGRSVERGDAVEKRPSTGKDHPTGRSHPLRKHSPAEEGQSADRGHTARQNLPTERGRLSKKSLCAEKRLSAESSCPPKKSRPAEKNPSSKSIHSAEKAHYGERGHLTKKKRQLSVKKGRVEKKFGSRESVEIHDSYTHEESNTGKNGCSVEEGHHFMEKDFPVGTPSSGSMPALPVPKSTQDAPESSIGSATSQVPQATHQNVAGAVTTGQHIQAVNMRMGVELELPRELKACIVEDLDLVNTHKQLFQLPAEKNVDHILENYVNFVKSQGKSDNGEYSVDELVYGIREYFNRMLGTKLLCQFEKPQYAEILLAYPDLPMSQIYGASHLLRLFVNIGSALTNFSLNRCSLMLVSSYMQDFFNYLSENSSSLFTASNYKMASVAYCFQAL